MTPIFAQTRLGSTKTYQTDYLLDARTVQPGGTASADARLFAGAKEVSVVNGYNDGLRSTCSIA